VLIAVVIACAGEGGPVESGPASMPPTGTPPTEPTPTPMPTTSPTTPTCLGPGDHDLQVEVDGRTFAYRLHVPSTPAPHPVIVQFHGGGSTGAAMELVSELSSRGDPLGFATLTPEGFAVGGSQVWNAGACCGPTAILPDHVTATVAMLEHAEERGACLDEARQHAIGHSNGAMMAYRLACEESERFVSVALSAGTLATVDQRTEPPTRAFTCAPRRPVSVLHVHGLEDRCVPYDGSVSASGNDLIAVEEAVAAFRASDCPAEPDDTTAGVVRRRRWDCADHAVELVTVEELGHAWAGSPIYGNPELCGGTTTTAVSTTDEALAFFAAP